MRLHPKGTKLDPPSVAFEAVTTSWAGNTPMASWLFKSQKERSNFMKQRGCSAGGTPGAA